MLNLQETFEKSVIDRFVTAYQTGPRPTRASSAIDASNLERYSTPRSTWICDYIATGHFAKTDQAPDGTWQLHRGEDKKDQSYFLYSLTQERLARTIFPLAGMNKERDAPHCRRAGFCQRNASRARTSALSLMATTRATSNADVDTAEPGDIVWRDGTVVGRHNGALRYTIGQRKGLGVAMAHPVYVTGVTQRAIRALGELET